MRVRRLIWLVAVTSAVIAIAAVGIYFYMLNFKVDRVRYPTRGIDVSHHQGAIDWRAVAADDVSFAYVKVSEGGDYRDERYLDNLAGAAAAGIPVGAYHYFTFCRSGADQASNYLGAIAEDKITLPPVVDLEFRGNCDRRPAREEVAREVGAFVSAVEARLDDRVIYYMTEEFRLAYGSSLPERPLWYRAISFEPFHVRWQIWQYADEGKIAGIDGPVDLNVLSESVADLAIPARR